MAKSLARVLKEASTRLEQYDFGSALHLYNQALAMAPNNAGAAMGMAMVLNRTGKPADAMGLLQQVWNAMRVAKPKPGAPQEAAVLAQMGLAQEQLGKTADALESYRQACCLVQSPDLDRRISQLAPLVSSPVPVQQLILNARRLQGSGQLQEAGKTFHAALQLQPDSAEALHGLAMVMRQLGGSQHALPLLQKAVMLTPDRADYYNDLGMLFQDRGDFTKAVSFHKRALKIDPRFVSAHVNLGVAYKRLGKLEESEAAYLTALTIDSRSAESHNNLGNLLRLQGRLHEAKKHLAKALSLRPGYADAKANLDAVAAAVGLSKKAALDHAAHSATSSSHKKSAQSKGKPTRSRASKSKLTHDHHQAKGTS